MVWCMFLGQDRGFGSGYMTVPLLYSLIDFSVVLLLSIVIHYVIVPFCRDVIKINRTLLLKQAMMHTCTVALHNCKLLQRGY